MSIWSSVVGADDAPNGPAEVLDLDADGADQYKGTSPVKVEVHVAIAPSWHRVIRLAIDSDDRWITLGLDDVTAGRLVAQLETARAELLRRGVPLGEPTDAPDGTMADVADGGEVRRLVRVDGEWRPA